MCRNKWMQKFVAGVMVAAMTLSIGAVSAMAASTTTIENNGELPSAPILTQPTGDGTTAEGEAGEVLGANRPVGIENVDEVSEGYDVVGATDTMAADAQSAVQNIVLNDITTVAGELNNSTLLNAAGNDSQQVVAEILANFTIDATTAVVDGSGNYNFTVKVQGVKPGDTVVALIFDGNNWVKVYPTVIGEGVLSFSTKVLGMLSIVRLDVRDVASAGAVDAAISNAVFGATRADGSAAAAASEGAVLGATRTASVALGGEVLGAGRSPKTADGSNGMLVMMAIACFAGAGALVAAGKNRA